MPALADPVVPGGRGRPRDVRRPRLQGRSRLPGAAVLTVHGGVGARPPPGPGAGRGPDQRHHRGRGRRRRRLELGPAAVPQLGGGHRVRGRRRPQPAGLLRRAGRPGPAHRGDPRGRGATPSRRGTPAHRSGPARRGGPQHRQHQRPVGCRRPPDRPAPRTGQGGAGGHQAGEPGGARRVAGHSRAAAPGRRRGAARARPQPGAPGLAGGHGVGCRRGRGRGHHRPAAGAPRPGDRRQRLSDRAGVAHQRGAPRGRRPRLDPGHLRRRRRRHRGGGRRAGLAHDRPHQRGSARPRAGRHAGARGRPGGGFGVHAHLPYAPNGAVPA